MAVYWLKVNPITGGYIITEDVEFLIEDKIKLDSLVALQLQPIGNTEKKTGVDAGFFGERSITNDNEYICVQGGVAGVAIWKKHLLSESL